MALTLITERVPTAWNHDCISKQVLAHAAEKILWNLRFVNNWFWLLLKWRSLFLAFLIRLAANEYHRFLTFWSTKFIHIMSTNSVPIS
jgi:hypothetical protein